MEVEDLFTDLADGKKLLKLLEIISGEKLGKPNNGKMRVHKVENVNKSLAFLHTKVRCVTVVLSLLGCDAVSGSSTERGGLLDPEVEGTTILGNASNCTRLYIP